MKLLFCPSLFLVNSQPLVPFVLCFPRSCARTRANPREQPGGASTRGALAGRPSGAAEGRGGTARAGLAAARGRSPAWRRRKQGGPGQISRGGRSPAGASAWRRRKQDGPRRIGARAGALAGRGVGLAAEETADAALEEVGLGSVSWQSFGRSLCDVDFLNWVNLCLHVAS